MEISNIITVLAICLAETNLRNVTNYKDGGSPSYGICQIKEATARQMDITTTKQKLRDINFNLKVARQYFEYHKLKYKTDDKAISAYNAGRFIKTNGKYVRRVKRQRQRLLAILPLLGQEPNALFGLFGLQFSKDIQYQLQNAVRLDAGN